MKNIFWKLLIFHIWVCSSSVVDFYVLCEVVVQFSFFPNRQLLDNSCWMNSLLISHWCATLLPSPISMTPGPCFWSVKSSFSLFVSPLPARYLIYSGTVVVLQYLVRPTPFIVFLFFCFPSLMYLSPFCSSSDSLFRIVAGIALSLKNNVMRSGMCLIKFISRYFKSVGC